MQQHLDGPSEARLHHLLDAAALKVVARHVALLARLLAQFGGFAREEDRRARLLEEEREDGGEGGRHGEEDPADGAEALDLGEVAEYDGADAGSCMDGTASAREREEVELAARASFGPSSSQQREERTAERREAEQGHRRPSLVGPPHVCDRPADERHGGRAGAPADEARDEHGRNVGREGLRDEEEGKYDGRPEVDARAAVDLGERGEEERGGLRASGDGFWVSERAPACRCEMKGARRTPKERVYMVTPSRESSLLVCSSFSTETAAML